MNNVIEAGRATRFKPGTSGNPGGRRRDSITVKVRDILERKSDLFEAVRIINAAEGEGADAKWNVEALTNGDLVALAVVSIALNRTGRVPHAVQLQALGFIWDRMDGKVDKATPAAGEDESKRPPGCR